MPIAQPTTPTLFRNPHVFPVQVPIRSGGPTIEIPPDGLVAGAWFARFVDPEAVDGLVAVHYARRADYARALNPLNELPPVIDEVPDAPPEPTVIAAGPKLPVYEGKTRDEWVTHVLDTPDFALCEMSSAALRGIAAFCGISRRAATDKAAIITAIRALGRPRG